jgi:RNase H-like domain found in reverse transcriptase/Reverse transcriptase (RNA-dependent DNA polymerase)
MDDILIYSQNAEEHEKHVKQVFQRLREAGLQVDLKKSEFSVTWTKFLGLIVTTKGIEMDPEKIKVIREWETPRNVTETQSFIGFCNFYRRFIKDFSRILRPVIELTRNEYKTNFAWNEAAQEAFEKLKSIVSLAPVLAYFDYNKTAYLKADSSNYVQGGCLS